MAPPPITKTFVFSIGFESSHKIHRRFNKDTKQWESPGIVIESDPVDNKFMFSYLTIAWFQNDWAMPIKKRVLKQIKCLNWDKYAVDGDY